MGEALWRAVAATFLRRRHRTKPMWPRLPKRGPRTPKDYLFNRRINNGYSSPPRFSLKTISKMNRDVALTRDPLDETRLNAARFMRPDSGAACLFLGVVRGSEAGAGIAGIDYEAFEAMALRQFGLILDEAGRQWPIHSVRVVHRTGFVETGAPSLWIEVVASHRSEAFAACQWIIDKMKEKVPIWKHPVPDGGDDSTQKDYDY